ncbi:sensor histidine kinase [Fluviicola taffensis]|uniref:sensor histidine kinase n=1 Tax=Fluviicola taffensis TaxID=191579 RepID=UPI0011D2B230|nr:histidine kinase [Fluviicola taffensis]
MIKYILFGLFFVGIATRAFSQTNRISWEYNYHHFGIKNGLPSSESYQVYQDKSGLLWILTDRGVIRYDGFEFHKYTIENGLSDNVNFRVVEDPNGGVWFVGYNGLLSVFKDGEMQVYKYNQLLKKALPLGKNTNISISVKKDNSIVYGVFKKKIISVSKTGEVKDVFKRTTENGCFFEFEKELIPLKNGVTFNLDTIFIVKDNKRFFIGKLSFSGTTRAKKHKGHYFVMTDLKLFFSDHQQFNLIPENQEVISLDCDSRFLYVGLYKNGLKKYRFNPKTKKLILVQHYLPNYSVSSACTDMNGTLWLTTLDKGLFAIYDEAFKQLAINGVNLTEEVRFINGNKNKIIITHYVGKWQQLYAPFLCKDVGKMVYKYNLVPVKNGFTFQRNVVDWSGWKDVDASCIINPIYATDTCVSGTDKTAGEIVEIKKHSTVFHGINRLNKTKLIGPYLWFRITSNNKIFILYDDGLFVFDIKKSRINPNYRAVLKKSITQLKYHKEWGLLAYSSSEGLFCVDIETEKYVRFEKNNEIGNQISTVFFDEKNRLWVATEKGLFSLVKKNGHIKIHSFLNKSLLSSVEVTDIYVYKNILYLTTKLGVQKIDLLKVKKTMKGCPITVFSVRAFSRNKEVPQKKIFPAQTDLIKISLSNKNLDKQNSYRYRFGKAQTWIKSDKGEINLNNPTNGEYQLEVSYFDSENNWSKSSFLTTFTVEKVIFLRWYFILLYVVLVIVLFYIILKLSIQSVNKKNYMLNRMMELEQMALSAQMNPHFIFNSLNSIHSFLLYEENENAERYLLRFAKLIRQTLSNSRATYITIEEEYETLKNYILLESMRFKNKFTFEIECNFNQLPLYPCIPPMLIQPYVENAIIHGLAKRTVGAELLVKFYVEEELLKVLIQDNGIGYVESKKNKRDTGHKSYGTQITEERLKSLQANTKNAYSVSINSFDESNKEFPGTCVILTIPFPK